jgi:hypothetical protein
MDRLDQLPDFDALDREFSRSAEGLLDVTLICLNKRIQMINQLADDIFHFIKKECDYLNKVNINKTPNLLFKYPRIGKNKEIKLFSSDVNGGIFSVDINITHKKKKNNGIDFQLYASANEIHFFLGQWYNMQEDIFTKKYLLKLKKDYNKVVQDKINIKLSLYHPEFATDEDDGNTIGLSLKYSKLNKALVLKTNEYFKNILINNVLRDNRKIFV